jgi:uncharacterized protein (DUF952 family)
MVRPSMPVIYKICPGPEWHAAAAAGGYQGSPADRRDGFIHLSTGEQVRETARRHFAGRPDLVLVAVDDRSLGSALRWEPSRGGELFPHIYGELPLAAVLWVKCLPWDGERHVFPPDVLA